MLFLNVGCERACEVPESLKGDLGSLRQQVLRPSVDPVYYANRLCDKIASLPNCHDRFACQKAWEHHLYQISVDDPNLRTRYSQFVFFCDIAGKAAYCILQSGGTEEDYWESRLRLLKWMQMQLSRLESSVPITPDDHHPRTNEELMRDSYWDMFHDAFDERVRHMEESFNDMTCSRVSPARQLAIRQNIERILGRRIRTNKEIQDQLRIQRKLLKEKFGL